MPEQLGRSNAVPKPLQDSASRFLKALDQPLDDISFDRLYSGGTLLEARFKGAVKRPEEGMAPDLPEDTTAELSALLTLYKPFILSTAAGVEMTAAVYEYDRQPGDDTELMNGADALGSALAQDKVVDARVAEHIHTLVNVDTPSKQTRATAFAHVTNVLAVVGLYGAMGAGIAVVVTTGPVTGAAGAAMTGGAWYIRKSLESSHAFKQTQGAIGEHYDVALEEGAKRAAQFLVGARTTVQTVAKTTSQWLLPVLDKVQRVLEAGARIEITDQDNAPSASNTIERPEWSSAHGTDAYGRWAEFTLEGVTQRMRWIPPGTFMMGSPDNEPDREDNEGPQHRVTLTQGYWLFDTPCTQALWTVVMGDNPSPFKGEDHPVHRVSWNDCQAFLERINTPKLALSLPNEAQWEYACRAGSTGARYAEELETIAWYAGNSDDTTHPVASLRPNAWGLYDMLGHVWEWCEDGQRPYTAEPVTDPRGPTEASGRVLRGGSWFDGAGYVRAAYRGALPPDSRVIIDGSGGFRCARVQVS